MGCKLKQATTVFLALLLVFICACNYSQPALQSEVPVEPVIPGLKNPGEALPLKGSFSIINPKTTIYALALSSSGRDILFSSEAGSVSMLDDLGRLRWEVPLEGLPVCAALASGGRPAFVGTDRGKVYCLDQEGSILWEKSLPGKVQQLALAPDGDSLAVSLEDEAERHRLYLFEQWGTLRWEKETGLLEELQLLPGNRLLYLEKNEESGTVFLLQGGEDYWQAPATRTAFAANGGFITLFDDGCLNFYQLEKGGPPQLLWSRPAAPEADSLLLTEGGERLLAYSSTFAGTGSNLFVFDQEGTLLWEKKIPGGSLLQVSRCGEKIAASSWQEYSENFSRLIIFDGSGKVLQELEAAVRIEKMALSGEGNTLALAGNDGHIFILDPAGLDNSPENNSLSGGDAGKQHDELYRPALFQKTTGETYLTLYFFDEQALHLVPVSRKVKNTPALLQTAVNELVKGPCRLSSLSRTLPKDVEIKVSLEEGIATVDLPGVLNRVGGTAKVSGIIDSLLLTVSQFSTVEGIQFLIDGEKAATFGAEGLGIEHVFARQSFAGKQVLYLPYRSGERYYLFPREMIALGNKSSRRGGDLLKILLEENRRILPEIPELKNFTVEKEQIILDWGSSLKQLFPWAGTPENKARAALFLDSMLLTLGSNYQCKRVVHLVEGQRWFPPYGYPALEHEFKSPFYLNPE